MNDSTTLFPDTNIFLHYKPLRDIDWTAIADSRTVKIVVCLQVIKELDAKKDDPRLSDRARRVIKELEEFVSTALEIRPAVTARIYNEEVRYSSFPDRMSPDSADDRIVFQVLQYTAAHLSDNVLVVTEDLGMTLRCKAQGLLVLRLGAELRLPEPSSELLKRNKQLSTELEELKRRLPELAVIVAPTPADLPSGGLELQLRRADLYDPGRVTSEMRAKNPYRYPPRLSPEREMLESLNMNAIPESEYTRYNRELDEYFAAMPEHIERINAFLDAKARTVKFTLWITNNGNTPADDVDVVVSFPDDVVEEVRDAESDPLSVQLPAPPEPPVRGVTRQLRDFERNAAFVSRIHNFVMPPLRDEPLRVATDGLTISAHVSRLKHGRPQMIGSFEVRYKDWQSVRPMTPTWIGTAGNHPQKMEGRLLFAIRPA